MAKRKRPWTEVRNGRLRVRWPIPYGGGTAGASNDDDGQPFEDQAAALQYGYEQMGQIRRGEWSDPRNSSVTFADWLNAVWWPAQNLAPKTMRNYRYYIEVFMIEPFGEMSMGELADLPRQTIDTWERGIEADGYAKSTASDARKLLRTILGDAIEAEVIRTNPAERPPRHRGRRSGRRPPKRVRKEWATPLEALLVAERAAVLGGERAFTLAVTIGWTGMRWSEATGMQREYLHGSWYQLDWQLQELDGQFTRVPLKDDSYRTLDEDGESRVDLPPFLASLLKRAMGEHDGKCPKACHCGGTGWIFLRDGGTHIRSSNFSRRVWRPACDGIYPGNKSRPVLVDATGWPGEPLWPWPAAIPGKPFEPPKVGQGRGNPRIPEETPLASWLPVKRGLTPHGLRHGHQTWMTEDRIQDVIKAARMGHREQGMQAHYTHDTDVMRAELLDTLQRRWDQALKARFELHPRSSVAVLDELLAPLREQRRQVCSQSAPKRRHLSVVG